MSWPNVNLSIKSPPVYHFLIIIPHEYVKQWFHCTRINTGSGKPEFRKPLSTLENKALALDLMSIMILIFHYARLHVLQA